MKLYGEIGYFRLLNIKVILDNTDLVYEGRVEDAPEEIRHWKYANVEMGNPVTLYIYTEEYIKNKETEENIT